MHQYFTDEPLQVGEDYYFSKEQAHHIKNVIRLDQETVRLVYEGKAYFATIDYEDGKVLAHVDREDPRVAECGMQVTLAMALIRKEKFELVLQKACELGVTRIVPFESSRCVVKAKKEKADRQKERWQDILQEAAEQCKRNQIPEITDIVSFEDLKDYQSDINMACYENAYGNGKLISAYFEKGKDVTFVIGPEGGFSDSEIQDLYDMGYLETTLGSRILRAETAAIYGCAVLSELDERE